VSAPHELARECFDHLAQVSGSMAALQQRQPLFGTWELAPAPGVPWLSWWCITEGAGLDCPGQNSWRARFVQWLELEPTSPATLGRSIEQALRVIESSTPQMYWLSIAVPHGTGGWEVEAEIHDAQLQLAEMIRLASTYAYVMGRERARGRL
jgi:hypothetical protein